MFLWLSVAISKFEKYLHDDTYLYEEQEQSLPEFHPHIHLLFHWDYQHHSDCFEQTRNGLREVVRLLQCQVGNETLCTKGSLSGEKERTPVTEDSVLKEIENLGGEMGE
jgi:hypothetical protein